MRQTALDATFAALANPIRRGIVAQLAASEATASDLAAIYRVSLPAISRHLGVLERAGLVRRRAVGRAHRCALATKPLIDAAEWLAFYGQFWQAQLDRLGEFVARSGRRRGK